MSGYLRKVGVDGFIINRDFSALSDVNRIGVNINQIAKKVNERGSVIDRDLDELRVQYSVKSFLEKVRNAAISLGKAPYDDKRTDEILTEATKRTVENYEKMKKEIENKQRT